MVQVAVLVPVKAFGAAKQRLSGVLSAADRAGLARAMATVVVRAAAPYPAFVVCDDDGVAEWAEDLGAAVLWRPDHGLNGAVRSAFDELSLAGFDAAVVAHGDLPLATTFAPLPRRGVVTLVPDRHEDGTNVMVIPTDVPFVFSYGPGSFRVHVNQAFALGLPVRVVRDTALGWDVDRPDDLSRVEAWISPDNQH